MADVCNEKYLYIQLVLMKDLHITVLLRLHTGTHSHHIRHAAMHRCRHVSPESNNVTPFSATIRLGRPTPGPRVCLSLFHFFFLFFMPVWHSEAGLVILPSLLAPWVQLDLQKPRSQCTMHRPWTVSAVYFVMFSYMLVGEWTWVGYLEQVILI